MALKIKLHESNNPSMVYTVSSVVGYNTDKASGSEATIYGGHIKGSIPYNKEFESPEELMDYLFSKLKVNSAKASVDVTPYDKNMTIAISFESPTTKFKDVFTVTAYRKVSATGAEMAQEFNKIA